ncbi:hypothetical protein GCM10011348_11970 [Marinobacterium nitratireducens]|uniref:Uncharacterized protein n=1 Tax=Marinobacterium nitratireducens TaxID=518897 RepID=A0A917ZA66_9GAMM|nr:hypothetical protein GCM10011348_11970 [Marinobacterium nitratireducens]
MERRQARNVPDGTFWRGAQPIRRLSPAPDMERPPMGYAAKALGVSRLAQSAAPPILRSQKL